MPNDRQRSEAAKTWVARSPKEFLLYGPFAHPKEALEWARKAWPDMPEDSDAAWTVEPLYPPTA